MGVRSILRRRNPDPRVARARERQQRSTDPRAVENLRRLELLPRQLDPVRFSAHERRRADRRMRLGPLTRTRPGG